MTTGQPHPVDPSPVLRAYGACVDGLFTYCLSVLCEHAAATAAVLEVRDLAQRHGDRLADPALLRAWLYALARHRCLARLDGAAEADAAAAPPPGTARERRRELASLAWPEAAGTDPEQREALELAVRHKLTGSEVAAVLGLTAEAAAELLDAAGAEVGRTRTALLVLGVGSCRELTQLGGVGAESWRGWVLGPALRRELVLHLVECPTCRGTAERVAGQLGHGLAGLPGLPLLAAPGPLRPASAPVGGTAFLAGAAAGRRAAQGPGEPRFDQRGFPRHRLPAPPRGSAVRQRVVTTGVLAAVLAAPVVALWSAHRDGGDEPASAVSSVRVDGPAGAGGRVPAPEPTSVQALPPATGTLQLAGAVAAETSLPTLQGPAVPVPSRGSTVLSSPTLTAEPAPAPSRLTVEAGEYGNRTVITLTNTGGSALSWHAVLDVDWLRLSRDAGTLAPGQRITVTVTVDESRVPESKWTAHLALPPSTAVVTLEGGTDHRGVPTPEPTPTPSASVPASPSPSDSPSPAGPSGSTSPSPSASPSAPASSSPSPSAPASASPSSSASPADPAGSAPPSP
ncbi:BACON domain-containing protein [Streptomyces sp. TLI_171]|uniref:BACON domain-containing protein n=1 Tax=Streptomyces sp. TLI_171 TaxID=1938859 RepID=UPI000C17E928|nr:sigma-70 family RNA polymerase sigma factor [Streptomyces sp. TLI_171]RKE19771.1 DNA-directed RNA polymerase specialized sigma24 family protein [Streptomyces sp. TLI_171]